MAFRFVIEHILDPAVSSAVAFLTDEFANGDHQCFVFSPKDLLHFMSVSRSLYSSVDVRNYCVMFPTVEAQLHAAQSLRKVTDRASSLRLFTSRVRLMRAKAAELHCWKLCKEIFGQQYSIGCLESTVEYQVCFLSHVPYLPKGALSLDAYIYIYSYAALSRN